LFFPAALGPDFMFDFLKQVPQFVIGHTTGEKVLTDRTAQFFK